MSDTHRTGPEPRAQFNVRLAGEERDRLEALAHEAGLTASGWIKRAIWRAWSEREATKTKPRARSSRTNTAPRAGKQGT